jgi:hypothetical protein
MIEMLALPAWDAPPRSLDDWAAQLAALGHPANVEREPGGECWLEVAPLRLRGYVVSEEGHVAAINFELHDPDPGPASSVVQSAARALGWEVHSGEGEDDEDDD